MVEADPVVKGQTAASSYKPAMLENGVRILVPPFVGRRRARGGRYQRADLRPPRRVAVSTSFRESGYPVYGSTFRTKFVDAGLRGHDNEE